MIFEVVNPSDACTLRAEDSKVAIAVTIMLGGGSYPLKDEMGDTYDVLLGFIRDENELDAAVHSLFDGKDFNAFVLDNCGAIIECLESVICLGIKERFLYDTAIGFMDEKGKLEFREIINEKFRTSMNDISATAWECAESLRGGKGNDVSVGKKCD